MRYIIGWAIVTFVCLVAFNRTDILNDIGSGIRTGVEAVQDGYNGTDSIKE